IRLRPKSNARTACAGWEAAIRSRGSGIAGDGAHLADLVAIEADELPRALPALLEGHAEHDALVGGHRQPGVLADLALELARIPAGIPEGYEGIRRSVAARHRLQNVARGRHLNAAGDFDRAVPLAARAMQHESAVGAYGTSAQHRLRGDLLVARVELHLLQHLREAHRQRLVEYDAERAFARCMLADESDRLREVRIRESRHRDQQVIGESRCAHVAVSMRPRERALKEPTDLVRRRLPRDRESRYRRYGSACDAAPDELPLVGETQRVILARELGGERIEGARELQ